VADLLRATNTQQYHRFPLTYIMEAADDISYCIADLDDAVEKAIFSVDQLYQFLEDEWTLLRKNKKVTSDELFVKIVGFAYTEAQSKERYRSRSDTFFMKLRVKVQSALVEHAVKRFVDNIGPIWQGSFNHSLLEDDGDENQLLNLFKKVARKHVFNHPEVEQLELQGYRVIKGLLDIYKPLLQLSYQDFNMLINEDFHPDYPIETRLFHKLSGKHRKAYSVHMKNLKIEQRFERLLWERYYRARLLQDYVSGMTDLYAWDEYRRLMAVE
jgi:dGTPase